MPFAIVTPSELSNHSFPDGSYDGLFLIDGAFGSVFGLEGFGSPTTVPVLGKTPVTSVLPIGVQGSGAYVWVSDDDAEVVLSRILDDLADVDPMPLACGIVVPELSYPALVSLDEQFAEFERLSNLPTGFFRRLGGDSLIERTDTRATLLSEDLARDLSHKWNYRKPSWFGGLTLVEPSAWSSPSRAVSTTKSKPKPEPKSKLKAKPKATPKPRKRDRRSLL